MKSEIATQARYLLAGDVLLGSGFVVTHNAWKGVHTPKGKVNVEGHYPNSPVKLNHWNASTSVRILR